MDTSAVYTVQTRELCRLKRVGDFRDTMHSDLHSCSLSFPLVVFLGDIKDAFLFKYVYV